jgi:hypothetical protein
MNFHGCPTSGNIYDDSGRLVHKVPEHAREEFRRSATQHGIRLIEDAQPQQASMPVAPKAPQVK